MREKVIPISITHDWIRGVHEFSLGSGYFHPNSYKDIYDWFTDCTKKKNCDEKSIILKILLNRLNWRNPRIILESSYFPLQFFAFKVAIGINVGLWAGLA